MGYCPNCGNEVKKEAKFCPSCGYDLTISNSEDEPQATIEKVKLINKNHSAEATELVMEKAEGMNITRAELKKEAQKRLSGRYGEWFKTIMWFVAGLIVSVFLILFSLIQLMNSGSYRSYGYYYSYNRPFSGISTMFWFLLFILILLSMLALACLINAVMQWCALFTLKGYRADGIKLLKHFIYVQKNRVLKANILTTIYTFLWGLLFVIPGIVKQASYAMTNYLLEKEPTLSANEAISLSQQIMHGYKLEFLILRFSFYFWYLAVGITYGVASFYVWPYQYVTEMKFLDVLYHHYLEKNE